MGNSDPLRIKRRRQRFLPDASTVITRFFGPDSAGHRQRIIRRVISLPGSEAKKILHAVMRDFSDRHRDLEAIFWHHYRRVEGLIENPQGLDRERKLLIGSFFTKEYAIASAACFNPSIVPHPKQTGLAQGSKRVIFSFRVVGEGHISSLTFRSGVLAQNGRLIVKARGHFTETAKVARNPNFDKKLFTRIFEAELKRHKIFQTLFDALPESFKFNELEEQIDTFSRQQRPSKKQRETIAKITWVARSNFSQTFRSTSRLSERVVFPVSQNESNGIEDARFVQFIDDNGSVRYYATFTAYDGRNIRPMLLETKDFLKFKTLTLCGDAVRDKGMALFPRRLDGKYAMISRQDGENMYLMYSDHILFWKRAQLIKVPEQSWEFVKIGNCGSPIETANGWLLLTHGVGAVRRYCIGALLLDLKDPAKIIGKLEEPLILPSDDEREGYVPNVVYTCGALLHNGALIMPYAVSDTASGIASIDLNDVLNRMG